MGGEDSFLVGNICPIDVLHCADAAMMPQLTSKPALFNLLALRHPSLSPFLVNKQATQSGVRLPLGTGQFQAEKPVQFDAPVAV